ncbi:hypothetical protein [Salinispora arenicola]|uniref:Uncharacterized protein n=2 Tax=Salinispora arenicola TaxID=168697 RepID=A0A542XT67_SALAC|nr:hypothetical protein [Salinispora arenicola]MCN0151258.1 hypothetical protein [Salinispora arenicola]MCN0176714.1 hypothetical protein [Salinispora arenicola]NIL41226.1 hypothetical protein [Salinispora arenicola]TQL38863.1 hypothetical protein FB564_4078 [Salinispora arenicola]GIM85686.1 hypothetical protein Sar04_24220 [Salinispora arenicola]
MSRHDEPNEYGFAGGATAPEPPPGGRADERDRAEEVAVPGDDLMEPVSEALAEEQEERRPERSG